MTDDARRARLVAPPRPDTTKRPIVVGTDVPAVSRGSAIRLFFCCRVVFGCDQKIGRGWGRPTPTSAIGSTTQNDVGQDRRLSPGARRLRGGRRPTSRHMSVRRALGDCLPASARLRQSRHSRRPEAPSIDLDARPASRPFADSLDSGRVQGQFPDGTTKRRREEDRRRFEREGQRVGWRRETGSLAFDIQLSDRPVAIPRGRSALAGGGASARSLAA